MAIETVDVANPAALKRALQRIERRLGPVTAVAHAVGVGGPRPVAELTEDELRAQVSAETTSLDRLVGAITAKRLRLIVTFGSVAQPYGLAGEGLLALASGSLADQALRIADGIPRCRALHVDWPAWSGSGLGQRDSLAEELALLRRDGHPGHGGRAAAAQDAGDAGHAEPGRGARPGGRAGAARDRRGRRAGPREPEALARPVPGERPGALPRGRARLRRPADPADRSRTCPITGSTAYRCFRRRWRSKRWPKWSRRWPGGRCGGSPPCR